LETAPATGFALSRPVHRRTAIGYFKQPEADLCDLPHTGLAHDPHG